MCWQNSPCHSIGWCMTKLLRLSPWSPWYEPLHQAPIHFLNFMLLVLTYRKPSTQSPTSHVPILSLMAQCHMIPALLQGSTMVTEWECTCMPCPNVLMHGVSFADLCSLQSYSWGKSPTELSETYRIVPTIHCPSTYILTGNSSNNSANLITE